MLTDKEIFIHVGLHKTASSFFQMEVFPRFKTIQLIANPMTQRVSAFNHLIYADDCFYNKTLVEEELNKIKNKKILISDESMTGQPLNMLCNNKTTIANRLAELFPNAKIILFIRGQKALIMSLYSQYLVHNRGAKFLLELFRHPDYSDDLKIYPNYKNNIIPEFGHYSVHGFCHFDCFLHYETIHLYKSLFKDVNVFLYEEFHETPEGILLKLENILGETMDLTPINYNNKINQSMRYKEFHAIRFYNKSKFILRKKTISDFFFFFYKILYLKKNIEQKEQLILNRIIKDYYTLNNQKILNEYPEIGIAKYPEYYQT
jgi:hypothetical protein